MKWGNSLDLEYSLQVAGQRFVSNRDTVGTLGSGGTLKRWDKVAGSLGGLNPFPSLLPGHRELGSLVSPTPH